MSNPSKNNFCLCLDEPNQVKVIFVYVSMNVFLLKILPRSRHFAPKFIESHYGTSAKTKLGTLEKVARKIEKRKANIF